MSSQTVIASNEAISKPLAHIINCYFSRGEFPPEKKIARVVPIKKMETTNINNYRPICKLTFFICFERLYSIHTTHSVLCGYQFGLRPQQITTQAILILIEFMTDALEHRQFAAGIFLDR